MKKYTLYILISFMLISMGLMINSCEKKKLVKSNCTTTISYKNDIAPMMQQHCTNCHSNGAQSPDLTTHSGVANSATNCYGRMNDKGNPMPPNGNLADSLIQKFSCWVTQGKLNN